MYKANQQNNNNEQNGKKEPKGPWDIKKPDSDEEIPFYRKNQFKFTLGFFLIALLLISVINSLLENPKETLIEYSQFKAKVINDDIKRVELQQDTVIGYTVTKEELERQGDRTTPLSNLQNYRAVRVDDPEFIPLLDEHNVEYYAIKENTNPFLPLILNWLIPIGILVLVWRFLIRRLGNMRQDAMSFGKNKAKIIAVGDTGVRFNDVAGTEEAKEELVEVVDFLKRPERYTRIGGKIPKGVLLVGAPGTGKTLLARAVSGEAGVPFFKMNGADFVEMFVGVGASRVRDLFNQAREKAPCIIFIDELDAIGKTRGYGTGSHDEREQTLNQLLVEMDGFDARAGVILLAATNRPETLDPALMRPGRFDRQVLVDKPDMQGREEILKIHSKSVQMESGIELGKVARSTPGLVGSDLANIVNEAALLAVRADRQQVAQKDFDEAIEKVMTGLEKKNRLINPKERKIVAFHETGHALLAHYTEGADAVRKISIVPRGMGALGYTLQLPEEDRFLLTEDELLGKIDVLLGGRAAEEIIFSQISTGAANDLTRATDIAKRMITDYGMSEKFHNMYLPYKQQSQFLGDNSGYMVNREYAETTQQYIDEETAKTIAERYTRAKETLQTHKDLLRTIAERLLETETLEAEEFNTIIATS